MCGVWSVESEEVRKMRMEGAPRGEIVLTTIIKGIRRLSDRRSTGTTTKLVWARQLEVTTPSAPDVGRFTDMQLTLHSD